MDLNKIYCGNSVDVLKTFPDKIFNTCITSPPYYNQRNYQVDGQLGNEKTFNLFLDNLINVFREVHRTLRDDGTCWVVLDDTYFGGMGLKQNDKDGTKQGTNQGTIISIENLSWEKGYPKTSMCLIPYRFAIRMVEEIGFILRNIIVWHKGNAMCESMKSRFTNDFEPVLFFSKKPKYYFEQQFEPYSVFSNPNETYTGNARKEYEENKSQNPSDSKRRILESMKKGLGRNKRAVWKVNTKSCGEGIEHFATFPEDLIKPMLQSCCPEYVCTKCGRPKEKIFKSVLLEEGTPTPDDKIVKENVVGKSTIFLRNDIKIQEKDGYISCDCNAEFVGGIVLDPFFGSGTVGVLAKKMHRQFVGIDLNSKYIKIANKRISEILVPRKLW